MYPNIGYMASKGVKWYRKLGIELILGLSIVNAVVIYKEATGTKMNIREFRKSIAKCLLGCEKNPTKPIQKQKHVLKTKIDQRTNKPKVLSCKPCYAKKSSEGGRSAAKMKYQKTKYFCNGCEGEPYMCISCFSRIHEK